MPTLITRPVTPGPTMPPGAAIPLLTQPATRQRRSARLSILRQRFRRQVPGPLQVCDVSLARQVGALVQSDIASAAACQGVTAEVERGVVTLYGSVETTWRKERLATRTGRLPGVKQLVNHLLAQDELATHLQQRFQMLVTAGALDHLPKLLVEHQMVELYGAVAPSEQRNLLEREALAVPGVRVVLNHLSVPRESGPWVHTTNR